MIGSNQSANERELTGVVTLKFEFVDWQLTQNPKLVNVLNFSPTDGGGPNLFKALLDRYSGLRSALVTSPPAAPLLDKGAV